MGDIMNFMKQTSTIEDFGKRLSDLRKALGLTQKQLGEKVGVSNRVIAYYEGETDYPLSPLTLIRHRLSR